ncbi:MAG: AmmeMemoRadiSam system protein A [Thiohalomonadaceae bacterium]
MITEANQQVLLRVAESAIQHGLEHGSTISIDAKDYPAELRSIQASFVTLHHRDKLRGCIGSLTAIRPLVEDVARHAYAAAFEDPRFTPLSQAELPDLTIHISILSRPEPLQFANEAELLQQLRPGIDGIILQDQNHRATFLPSVWESLPAADNFWQQLKRKAGLPADWWSNTLQVERYTTQNFTHSQATNENS